MSILTDLLQRRSAQKPLGEKSEVGRIAFRRFAGPEHYVGEIAPFRVAHLTDLHVGRVTPMAVQMAAVDLVNRDNPDLVVITGDFVCHSQMFLEDLEEVMKAIKAPVYGVLGNHDYWSGASSVKRSLKKAGVELLENANTIVTINGKKLQLLGLDDAYTGHADREKALRGLTPGIPTLGLSHIAEEADGLFAHGVPFVLSGHTHGGQVTLASLHELAIGKLGGHKYIHGLYGSRAKAAPGAVYVGAGIGAAVIPLRLGERGRREVAIFELGTAPGAFDEHHQEQIALPGRKPTRELVEKRRAKVESKRLKREKRIGHSESLPPKAK